MTGTPGRPASVRLLEPDEYEVARALVRRTWEISYAELFSPEDIAAFFDGPRPPRDDAQGFWPLGRWGAFLGARLVGSSSLEMREDGNAELRTLYVDPDRQGRGAGRALWDAAVERARAERAGAFIVRTLARAPALEFYRHLGAEEIGRGTLPVGRCVARTVILRLELAPRS